MQLDLLAACLIRPEALFLAAAVVVDHGVGRVQYDGGRAVVLLQADHLRALEILFKF